MKNGYDRKARGRMQLQLKLHKGAYAYAHVRMLMRSLGGRFTFLYSHGFVALFAASSPSLQAPAERTTHVCPQEQQKKNSRWSVADHDYPFPQ